MSVSQGSKILASDCVSTNTASTLVLRDGSGDFAANAITSNILNLGKDIVKNNDILKIWEKLDANDTSQAVCGGIKIANSTGRTPNYYDAILKLYEADNLSPV